ncbi:MAG: response regulator [Nanoarchaeota archaeon]
MSKILVVDDNRDVVFSVIDGLKSLGMSDDFLEANGGREALEKMKDGEVDLILLDIMMPDIDGWEVAASLKGNLKTKDIPIIFLTAKTDDLSKGIGNLASADYVEKPFDIQDLKNRIQAVLRKS